MFCSLNLRIPFVGLGFSPDSCESQLEKTLPRDKEYILGWSHPSGLKHKSTQVIEELPGKTMRPIYRVAFPMISAVCIGWTLRITTTISRNANTWSVPAIMKIGP
jgi:hypothetical protein